MGGNYIVTLKQCVMEHCGYSNMVRFNFVAINCEKIADPLINDVEFTESVEMSISDIISEK